MAESYIEVLVPSKTRVAYSILKYVLFTLSAAAAVTIFLGTYIIGLLVAFAFAFLGYMAGMNADVEFEYLYVDKELTVDKVLAKTRRKRVGSYDLGKMEIIAPLNSHELDSYRNRQVKVMDFSTGIEEQPETRYAIYYEGSQKLIISPNEALLKAMKNNAPRKVFL